METHSSQSEYSLESHGQGVEKVEETHMVVCCAKLYTDGEESGFCPLNNKYEDMADNEKMEGQTCVEGELGEGKGEGQVLPLYSSKSGTLNLGMTMFGY